MSEVPLNGAGIVVDTHAHPTDFLPRWPRRLYRWILRRTIPPPAGLAAAGAAGVSALVVSAVGDALVTRLYGRRRFAATTAQLRRIGVAARAAGAAIATSPDQLVSAHAAARPTVILGLEGADSVGRDLTKLKRLHDVGVRVVVPVHLGNNRIGTTSMPWQGYIKHVPFRHARRQGLTPFGRSFITRMNELGMIVDVAHADTATLMEMVATSTAPVIASHSGAKAVTEFERYLTDAEILAVAGTGGLIGLWPYYFDGQGVASMAVLMEHARHIADLVGAEHLCVGTDMNGVPGVMRDGGGADEVSGIGAALRDVGFSDPEVRGILGENFLRVFATVTGAARGLN